MREVGQQRPLFPGPYVRITTSILRLQGAYMTNSGKKWYNNGTINKMFSRDDAIPDNFVVGKIQKASRTNTGKKAYTDGLKTIFISSGDAIPPGFKPGVSDKQKAHLKDIAGNSKGIPKSDQSKQKLREKALIRLSDKTNHPLYGKHHSEETRRKLSEIKKGKEAHNKGKHLTEEQKTDIANKHIEEYGSLDAFYRARREKASATKLSRYGDAQFNNSAKAKESIQQDPNFYPLCKRRPLTLVIG